MNWYLWIISILAIGVIFVFVVSYFECKKIRINNITINHKLIPESFDGTSFVFISDLHNAEFGINNEILINKIKELSPEFVILGGDMIIGKDGYSTDVARDFINSISKEFSVYYGIGNHEMRLSRKNGKLQYIWEKYFESLDNVFYMKDKMLQIKKSNKNINIIGLDLDREYYKRCELSSMKKDYLHDKVGEINEDEFNILIAHNPDYFNEYSKYGANLVLSGHVHGGIVRIPFLGGIISPRLRFFPKYDKGLYNINDSFMILSSGLGTHSIKLRFNNIPEIVNVTLKKVK